MTLASNAARMIRKKGETMTLRRSGETDLALKGKRVGGALDPIGGSAAQQAFTVRIAPTELAASSWAVKAPRRTDQLVIAGVTHTVLGSRPLSDGDTVAMHELEVSG